MSPATKAGAPADIQNLGGEIDAAERDGRDVAAGLSDALGTSRVTPGSWSVAECLDHMAVANRVYLKAMTPAATGARKSGRMRTRPALPGWPGRMFIATLEPPPKWWTRLKAPQKIRPRESPALSDGLAGFLASQAAVRAFLEANADLDLARIHFSNPLVPGIRFSLATGLHVITAHERRHLAQAWRVRRAIELPAGGR
jgi:hypothetical protein